MVPLAHDAHFSTYVDPLIGLVACPIAIWVLLFVSPLELSRLCWLEFA
jgi:ABC-type nickel/cobalt efflux system permease component RcnA